jgi:DnaJ domain
VITRGAVELALDLYRHPIKVKAARKSALPADVVKLIRIVSGSDEEIAALNLKDVRSPTEMREAAAFFMQQILFLSNNTPHRMLGLDSNAEAQQIKDHKRLLLKWLHPDRNQNKWESVYFQRVLKAAETLEGQPITDLEPTDNNWKSKRTAQTAKIKLHAQPMRRSLRSNLRHWVKRIFIFGVVVLLLVTAFSLLRQLGYVDDDLPWLDKLRAWLR